MKRRSDVEMESLETSLSEGRPEETHDLLIRILQRPQLSADFLLRLGILLAQRERYGDAADVFRRCTKDHPEAFEGYYNLALAEIAEQNWEAALATVRQAPQNSKAEVLACSYLRGKVENAQGKTGEAGHDLAYAFAGAPQNSTYGLDLGLFYLRQHAYPKAAAVFERAATFNSTSTFLLLGLSLSRFLAGQHEQSTAVLKKLLAVQPDFAPARLLLAFVLSDLGKFEDAEKVARQGLIDPDPSPYLYYLHASVLVKLQSQQYRRIFDELGVAQREIPSCSLCYLTESKAHQAQGNMRAAIADLETATQMDASLPEAWYRLTLLYRRVGLAAEALRAQSRFQELKADREERETQMLRDNFLRTMEADQPAQ